MKSRRAIRSSKAAPRFNGAAVAVCAGLLAVLSASAIWFFYSRGWLLYFGDAEAHLNIARRITDSQTPGYDQLGTYWLPLTHVLMLPFARVDEWWCRGIAASFAPGICFVIGGTFLFAAARRILGSTPAAAAAAALTALNPNLLYLQSTAMTEAVFFAAGKSAAMVLTGVFVLINSPCGLGGVWLCGWGCEWVVVQSRWSIVESSSLTE